MKAHDVMNIPGNLYLEGKPGRTCRVDGQEFMFFSGYNYLGVNEDEEFIALVNEGISKYGWVFPSSRISNTRLALYEECEAMLSAITRTSFFWVVVGFETASSAGFWGGGNTAEESIVRLSFVFHFR